MNRLMKNLTLLLVLIYVNGGLWSQSPSFPEENWTRMEEYLKSQQDFSGMIMFGQEGQIRINFASGLANRAQQIPYSDQTLGTIGSITKPFTATAIMLLMEQGKLRPSDHMTQYLDGVPDDKKDITLHHLLTHTAGFPGAIGDDYGITTDESFLSTVWTTPLIAPPGATYQYSNVGYSLLAILIEKVSGQSYSTFLEQNIFRPAGMKTAGYKNPAADPHLLSHGYRPDGSDWGTSHDKPWNGDEPFWHLKGNGGLLMSAQDLYQWYLALRNHKILTPGSLALQTSPHVNEGMEGSFYGYGYVVDPEGYCVQHNGGNGIFKADFRWFPKSDIFLYATTNDANVRLFRLADQLMRILETGELPEQYDWVPLGPDPFPSNENEQTAHALTQLLKDYSLEKAKTFISQHVTEGSIQRNGEDRLMEIFAMLSGDTGGHAVENVMKSGENILLVYPAGPMGASIKIIITLLDHRIDRISAEWGN